MFEQVITVHFLEKPGYAGRPWYDAQESGFISKHTLYGRSEVFAYCLCIPFMRYLYKRTYSLFTAWVNICTVVFEVAYFFFKKDNNLPGPFRSKPLQLFNRGVGEVPFAVICCEPGFLVNLLLLAITD